jgi:hypothetical protein
MKNVIFICMLAGLIFATALVAFAAMGIATRSAGSLQEHIHAALSIVCGPEPYSSRGRTLFAGLGLIY